MMKIAFLFLSILSPVLGEAITCPTLSCSDPMGINGHLDTNICY